MPPRRRSFEAVVRATETVLRTNRVDHVYVGGLSVMAFGAPRATVDVDVIAAYGPRKVEKLGAGFRRRGFLVSSYDLRAALEEGSHVTIDDPRSLHHIDLVPATESAHRNAIANGVRVRLFGTTLPIARAEHTIVMKLKWGSDRDLEDALGIYVRQRGRLDADALLRFARSQRVVPELLDLQEKAGSLSDEP